MLNNIYYFNNAATTWPKPQEVVTAVTDYFVLPPINSARHCNCVKQNEDVDVVVKRKIAEFFNIDRDKYSIAMTGGATYSANTFVYWLQKQNKDIRLITDNNGHNSIYRTHFEKIGTDPIILDNWDELETLSEEDLKNSYIAITHENNVSGDLISDETLDKIFNYSRQYNIPIIIDITQSAGTYEIDVKKFNYDNLYIMCSGHKGLMSVTGIGFLVFPKDKIDIPFISGGTGGVSGIDYKNTGSLEAGTPNELAMSSLIAGLDYITSKKIKTIKLYKEMLVEYFLSNYNLVNPKFKENFELIPITNPSSGIISFKLLNNSTCVHIIEKLTKDFHIMFRTGVHCAPLYHINVLKCESTLRLSFGYFNKVHEIDYLIRSINQILI